MGTFINRVRLPIRVHKPQYADDKETYRDAAGNSKTLSVVVHKLYQMETDYITEQWHEKIKIALAHDNVSLEGEKYFGGLSQNDNYDIAWSDDVPNYPIAPAKVTVEVTPFDATNSNCATCDELNQISLVDDAFPYIINENTTVTLDVIGNDSVCCYPVVFSITSFNTDFLTSASIDANGILTIHTKTGLVATNGADLVTYRATCDSGQYDEADVTGNINGTVPGCLAPTSLTEGTVNTSSCLFSWGAPSPTPDHYYWQVLTPALAVVFSGTTGALFVTVGGLSPSTNYIFRVRSQCSGPSNSTDDATASNWISMPFMTTEVSQATCGSYEVTPNAGGNPGTQGFVNYTDCNGASKSVHTNRYSTVEICALQSAPGVPIDIHVTGFTGFSVKYIGLCN